MVRAIVRGGVWKNAEDEILKAAIMKYGQQSWPRVASLLNRKTSKQCKARWYEWLDPSVKKTDWSREEEEKLLHLAKLMPNQWRTIAPIVGRTAGQCIEHYEKLLDSAQAGAGDTSSNGQKIKVSEIDSAPENKPARPDPVDMDEDEKEMLQEARARLANTQGKKEKRKQRERQLNESRKLALLQKRRELKAAGLVDESTGISRGSSKKRRRGAELDLTNDIPYFEAVPKGYYDASAEQEVGKRQRTDPRSASLEVSKMEGAHVAQDALKRRADDARRLKMMMQENAPEAIKRISEQNDPAALHRRSALVLPAPAVPDESSASSSSGGGSGKSMMMLPPTGIPRSSNVLLEGGGGSSHAPNNSSSHMSQRTPLQENLVMQEAQNQLRMRSAPAPLSGEEMPELQGEGTGWTSSRPRPAVLATPSLTPGGGSLNSRGRSAPGSQTPLFASTPQQQMPGMSSVVGGGSTLTEPHLSSHNVALGSRAKAARDSDDFSVTDYDGSSVAASSMFGMERARQRRDRVKQGLSSLPAAEYTYEVSMPLVESAEETANAALDSRPRDRAEVEAEARAATEAERQAALARRSTAVKRALPLPKHLTAAAAQELSQPLHCLPQNLHAASSLISVEMCKVLARDCWRYWDPSSGGGERPPEADELEVLPDTYLAQAREQVQNEVVSGNGSTVPSEGTFASEWDRTHDGSFLPGKYISSVSKANGNNLSFLQCLEQEHSTLKESVVADGRRCKSLEEQIITRSSGTTSALAAAALRVESEYARYSDLSVEINSLKKLQEAENSAIAARIAQSKQELQDLLELENTLQRRYAVMQAM